MASLFINVGLVAGVALAALPVILHLFLRQTPKHVIFPALRLIRERQKRSRKKLRIKNWLLLLARMALLALMALALARPRLWSQTKLGDFEVPTALALVFDTSLSMEYKERDQTRLDEAKVRARELLSRAHEASRVFVLDSAVPIQPVALSPAAARKLVDGLTVHAVNRPLNAAVVQADKAVAAAEQIRKEVFIFTDLSRSAWDTSRAIEGLGTASAKDKNRPTVVTCVLRLAPKVLKDVAIVAAEPAADFTAQDEPVPIRVVVHSVGAQTRRIVEFLVDGQKRSQQEVTLPPNGEATLRFLTPKLTPGLHRAEVKLSGEPDSLEKDDHRFVTLDVQPPLKVLVAADRTIDADFVEFALDPLKFRAGGNRPFPVTRATPAQLVTMTTPLKDYACVFLLNVADLDPSVWAKLNQYVREGGGLVVAVGDRVDPETLNAQAPTLLPATLGALVTPKEADFTFGKADIAHPIFSHETQTLLTELSQPPIYKYRAVKPLEGARTLLSYQNDAPALLERVFAGPRAGRVLLWTTALSRRPGTSEAERQAAWNDFPIVGWSFFAVLNQTVPYLAGAAGRRFNYDAGEDVTLPIEPGRRYTSFTLQAPGAKTTDRLSDPLSGSNLLISAPPILGPWTVTAGGTGGPSRTLGFSVNYPVAETDLAPLSDAEIQALLGGPDRVKVADDTAEGIKGVVDYVRLGHELYPYVMALILLIVTLENVLANTFYRESPAGAGASQGRTSA